jgi:DNA-directed RNA polymerase specialized sigma24 family protein
MLFDDGGSGRKSGTDKSRKNLEENDESQKTLKKIIERISETSLAKHSSQESKMIDKGKSVFDVVQEKLIEFWKKHRQPETDPEENSKWINRNIHQGVRKLHKYSDPADSIDDDENFNPKHLAYEPQTLNRLEKLEIVEKVFDKCSKRNQVIVELGLFVEIDYAEIAKITNTTEVNVRQVIYKFKKDCCEFGIHPPKAKQNKNSRGESNGA